MTNAATSIIAIKSNNGTDDFEDITINVIKKAEPSIKFVDRTLTIKDDQNTVALLGLSASRVTLMSRTVSTCYFLSLGAGETSIDYGKSDLYENEEDCPLAPREWFEHKNRAWR